MFSFSVFILEIGLLGTATVFLLYWLVFRDSLVVARHDQALQGSLAIGWAGVVVVFAVAMFYKYIHNFVSLLFVLVFFRIDGREAVAAFELIASA